ncbi:MAG TPA: hypothetical protein PL110_05460 [Candidatus Eremiobacteraeota bacterium]|nr:MAG: hypothetical protein BWY64_02285 [bacterium ADurb.Bin363]HPZ07539.1 hypothetical protein [Candidatus Eremiobacteraeota bacterium]
MLINCGHIHTTGDWQDTVNAIKTFMKSKGFLEVLPAEHIPELLGVDYYSIAEKNLRFFIITRSNKGWTGIFEDGGQNADKELACYISEMLNRKTIWTICSTSLCNYLYTIFDQGEIVEELARGDAYDYDETGNLKYFEFYNEEKLTNFLSTLNITTPVVTYEEITANPMNLNLTREDYIHLAFKKPEEIKITEEEFIEDDIEEKEKTGFFNKMMERLTRPIWDKLGKDMETLLPQIQKGQEMTQLARNLMEQGLKGEELRKHPSYEKLLQLEKDVMEGLKNSPYYSEDMEGMLKQGLGLTQKILKPYVPLEEEIKKLDYARDFSELATTGKKIIELSSGIKIDPSEKSIKRIDKAVSWAGKPDKVESEKFKLAIGSLIGEIIIKNIGGEWVKAEEITNSFIRVKEKEINPFKWYDEKINKGEKFFFQEEYLKIVEA